MIRTLIADDEPLARKGLRSLLSKHEAFHIVGESSDGLEAVEHIRTLQPDVVFLDVQMPGLDGFGVVRTLGEVKLPVIVFVTAYDQYALDAFRVHALDYLLKPIDRDQFAIAIERVHAMLARPSQEQIADLVRALAKPREYLERLMVKGTGKMTVLPLTDVDYFHADGDYVRIHIGSKYHLIREKLSHLEEQLDPAIFVRVHRSSIVRIDRIRELKPLFNGDHVIILRDGQQLSLSRTYRDRVLTALGGKQAT